MPAEIKDKEPIEPHATHRQRLIEHAYEQLAKGDRLQASEKGWGAVVHQLKAIADLRGWKCDVHQDVFPIIDRLAEETANPQEVRDLFGVARSLHRNYYIDATPLSALKQDIGRVEALLEILNRPELMYSP